MNFHAPFRIGWDVCCLAAYALIGSLTLLGQASAPPFTMAKQFSTDQVITDKSGTTIANKMFMDGDKIRTEMNAHGVDVVSIVLPDERKIYSILPSQKMVMVMPFDAAKFKDQTDAFNGKFELAGSEVVEGIPCTKYREVVDNKTYFLWTDAMHNIPVRMTAADGSFTAVWKNYKVGPQDPALFVIPDGYQTMAMPAMPQLPSGPATPAPASP